MDDLIKALTILKKYGNPEYPFNCDHDILYVVIDPNIVSVEDREELDKLGFIANDEEGNFYSFKYGSC